MSNKFIFDINFKNCTSHSDIISKFNLLYDIEKESEILLNIDFDEFRDFIYPDYALIILSYLKFFKDKFSSFGGKITNLRKSDPTYNYLERMNFFYILGNDFIRYKVKAGNSKSFLAFSKYDDESSNEIIKTIVEIIAQKVENIEKNVLVSLSYCLGEILDNINNYTVCKTGWVVCQYFKQTNKIRLMICDKGQGILNSLRINNINKKEFVEGEALEFCIEDKITSGKGQGHGLFATATFVEDNKGNLTIHSNEYKLNFHKFTNKSVVKTSFWHGTIVFLDINTNVNVDYHKFTSTKFDEGVDVFDERYPNALKILESKGVPNQVLNGLIKNELW